MADISIVTCSYQQGKYLESTLRSVVEQHYRGLEYIVVDGGSVDGSVDIIKRYDRRLAWWVSERDRGQTDALRKGFERATGEILGWLCSDDLLLPGALEFVVDYFRNHPEVDFLYGNSVWIDEFGDVIRPKKEMPWNKFAFLFDHNFVAQPSTFWRRSLYEQVGGLDASWNLAMDADLWLRFSERVRPIYVDRYLSAMRYYEEQKTRSLVTERNAENERLRRRHMPMLAKWPPQLSKVCAKAVRGSVKLLCGGYAASVSTECQKWLQGLRVDSDLVQS